MNKIYIAIHIKRPPIYQVVFLYTLLQNDLQFISL